MHEQMGAETRWPPKGLMDKLRLQGVSADADSGGGPAVVSLEDFFVGNDNDGSFAPNVTLPPPPAPAGPLGRVRSLLRPEVSELPGPAAFYELFKRVRDREEVQDVLVAVDEIEREADDHQWPWSDTVYILARASPEEVARWLEGPLHPDDLSEGYGDRRPPAAPELRDGARVFTAWWD